MSKVLIAGATGYLGKFITLELNRQNYHVRALVRDAEKLKKSGVVAEEIIQADITNTESIKGCCEDIDIVISSVGITRQKDGLTYMDVDYQANLNLLQEAKKSGVRKFIYISVLNGEKLKNLKICEAKEKFVEELTRSGLDFCVIRPNGFFSDMVEFCRMAEKGRIYLFGNGKLKSNPIHGVDLAKFCVDAIKGDDKELNVGGPEVLTQNEIAEIAFDVVRKPLKITYIPDWLRLLILRVAKLILNAGKFGPIEFFMNVMAIDMVAPVYGEYTLKKFFGEQKEAHGR